ncbi:MAG: enoyl-CoA hydratase/isomerase family protein [Sporichthyaceae bacterium]
MPETLEAQQLVDVTMDGAVAVLSMKSPPYNLLDEPMCAQLLGALREIEQTDARAIVLRSAMRHFSAGADLDTMLPVASAEGALDWGLLDVLDAFRNHPLPIVASVHGVCVGGGFELALASDLIVATESAKIGCVEVTVGLHPLMGAIQRITERAGAARAAEMAMLGRRYDAATLERWNILNRVVPDADLETATGVLAQELAHGPTIAHTATKRLIAIAANEGVAAADAKMADLQRSIYLSNDFKVGVESYKNSGVGMARFEGR